ncbi:MAG: carbohydrate ABC transporter permease [Clostridia bacterium]|nr:carbohydrate ABC transporter permease [Clostridia bacterium]
MIKSKSEKAFDIFNVILMILLTLMFVLPVVYIVSTSFSSNVAITKHGYSLLIREFTFDWYKFIFSAQDLFVGSMFNSIFMTVTATFFMVIVTSLYAYAVSRKQTQFKTFFVTLLIIPMLFAGGTIPYYLTINDLGLMNTQWAIILPSSVNAWYIILVKNYFAGLPDSLCEAAQLEGANNVQTLFKVVFPLGFPIVATVILYSAVAIWNDWFQASLFLDSAHKNLWPVQAVVRELNSSIESLQSAAGSGSDRVNAEGVRSAAVVISTLPIVIVYPFLQKYFISGVLVGSVKE